MKRPLAYITAAWCGSDHENTKLAAQYCRTVYEAGFSPICPTLYQPLFLNDAVPEEHKSGIDMGRDLLRRSHVLVVCGHTSLMMNFPHGLKKKRKIFKSWSMLENGQKQKRQKHLSITMKSLNLF